MLRVAELAGVSRMQHTVEVIAHQASQAHLRRGEVDSAQTMLSRIAITLQRASDGALASNAPAAEPIAIRLEKARTEEPFALLHEDRAAIA